MGLMATHPLCRVVRGVRPAALGGALVLIEIPGQFPIVMSEIQEARLWYVGSASSTVFGPTT